MKNKGVAKGSASAGGGSGLPSHSTKALLSGSKSFEWIPFLMSAQGRESHFAPVSSFKCAPLADVWDDLLTLNLKVEVKNTESVAQREGHWIASVVSFAGYYVLLRYEGFGNDASQDFWVSIFTNDIHPVGWCAAKGKILMPPSCVEGRQRDWKHFLVQKLTGCRTLPETFLEQFRDALKSKFQPGMRLEVVDKQRISAVRAAVVNSVIGGRLHIKYEHLADDEEPDTGFWCHQFSPLIHPVGWAQLVGHELKSTADYAEKSLFKAVNNEFDLEDAVWTMFPPVKQSTVLSNSNASNTCNVHSAGSSLSGNQNQDNNLSFRERMKLEAIDPINLSTICVATVMKLLRCNYLVIGIDGYMSSDGADWFCYHASSPCIFPAGFCKANGLELTAPKEYEGDFDWDKYLADTRSVAAPSSLFQKDNPVHAFKEGSYLEAVDLMEPRLVCVARVKRVVGRLLLIHFEGWDDSYDQWCDCESPDLFPIGWCHLVNYPLEPPKTEGKGVPETKKRGYKSKRSKMQPP